MYRKAGLHVCDIADALIYRTACIFHYIVSIDVHRAILYWHMKVKSYVA